jgi:hypothetical protein
MNTAVSQAVASYRGWVAAQATADRMQGRNLALVARLSPAERLEYAEITTRWDSDRHAAEAAAELRREAREEPKPAREGPIP